MTDSTTAFFTALGEKGYEPLLRRVSGTLRFDLVTGKQVERWLVTVAKGDVTVSHRNVKADCVIRTEKSRFEEVAQGRMNAMAATLRGVVAVEGDFELLVNFQRLFPGPPGARGRVEAIPAGRRT